MISFLVGEGGFEPPKALPADLQSVPFGHSGIPPYKIVLVSGAGGRTRTPDLLITNQLLYQLSYTSTQGFDWSLSTAPSTSLFIIPHCFWFVKYFFQIFLKKFLTAFWIIRQPRTLGLLVEATGLEPAASWSQTKHSTKLSYASLCKLSFQTALLLYNS